MIETIFATDRIVAALIAGFAIFSARLFRLAFSGAYVTKAPGGGAGRSSQIGGGGGDDKPAKKAKIAKWFIFAVHGVAGICFFWATLPIVTLIVGWLGKISQGWLAAVASGLLLWAGWWSVSGLVALVRDLLDGSPDDEANTSAVLIPSLMPLGGGAFWGLMTNPQGASTFAAALVASLLCLWYMHQIWTKVKKARTGSRSWSWIMIAVGFIVGIVHIPTMIYVNGWLPDLIPSDDWVLIIRITLGLAGLVLFCWFLGDCLNDIKKPEIPTFFFVMYAPSLIFVFAAFTAQGWDSSGGEVMQIWASL